MQLRPSFVCAHTDAALYRGLLNALFIALGLILLIFAQAFQLTPTIAEMSELGLRSWGRRVARRTASFRFLPKSRRFC